MHKKKPSSEINKYSSEFNLQSKLNYTVEYAEKAIQHDDESNKIQEKECKPPAIPKTKFTTKKSHESFSTSSSRLKSFPAEEIRRIQLSPKPETNSNYQQNSGQGDGFLQSLYCESSKMLDKNFLLNQEHLPTTEYKQIPPEGLSFHQKTDGQIHRPFVPVSRGLNIKEPHFGIANHIGNFSESNHGSEKKEMLINNNESNLQALKSSMNDLNEVKYEKEPENRNFMLNQLENMQRNSEFLSENKNPQIMHQQNVFYKIPTQISPHNYLEPEYLQTTNYKPNYQQIPVYGMTSPQDLMINRLKISQNNHVENQHNNTPNTPRQYLDLENKLENKHPIKSSATQQLEYHEYPPRRLPRSQNKEVKKKVIQFTPAMKHDQELLISKLKQQGISEEIIKRQFDALLTEQKRQLSYLQQLVQPENVDKTNKVVTKRKISRNSEDGKPEWMAHITPSRITCASVDKIKSNQNITKQQKKIVEFNDNVNENKGSKQTIQYWHANDRQNGMYVKCRNGYQHWHRGFTHTEDYQCNCQQSKTFQHQQYPIQQQNFSINTGHFPVQYQKQYPEINPLGNGYFILYDPSYQYRNNQEITSFKSNYNHHPYPHDYYNYQQNNVGNQQTLIDNPTLKQHNQLHNVEMSGNFQEANLNGKQKESVVETSNSGKFNNRGNMQRRNNGLQDL